jgi:hypothetical protein
MSISYYDITKFGQTRTEQKVIKVAEKATPLFNALPTKIISGTEYETPRLKDQGSVDIWANYGQGALTLSTDFDKVTTKTYGIDVKVEVKERIARAERSKGFGALGQSRFDFDLSQQVSNVLRRAEKQLWYGQAEGSTKGMLGLPDVSVYSVDALKEAWNGNKDYAVGSGAADIDTDVTGTDIFTDVYLLRAAPGAQADGLALVWGNDTTIDFGERQYTEVQDAVNGGSYGAHVQHIYADLGLQSYSDIDVVKITNVPTILVDGLNLDTVLSRAHTLFPATWQPTHVLMHKLAYQPFYEGRQNNGARNSNIQVLSDDGSFSGRFNTWLPFGLPILQSETAPMKSYAAGDSLSVAAKFQQVRDEAGVPTDA